jgi:hypothetical protein
MENDTLLSIAYLPPIEYYFSLGGNTIYIEKFENYQKQSFRNRTVICSPNGPIPLVIPVLRNRSSLITDVLIDNKTDWQRLHWRSITAAYNNSPFFLYYQDLFEPFFKNKFNYLFDFNFKLFEITLKILKWKPQINLTSEFIPYGSVNNDYRNLIHPKKSISPEYPFEHANKYRQVFENKLGFIPHLSILDLLCNEGPNSKEYIISQLRKHG